MAKILESPTVRFTQKAYQQICCLTDECPIEVSAMGVIATEQQRRDWGINERFYIMEFHVPNQTCSAASTVMETDSLSELAFSLRDKGINSEQVCVWWHSHVNMGTGHSGTDEKQIEDFDFDEVCISLITNKKGDLNCRVDLYNPVRFSFEDCDWCVDQINIIEDGWAKQMIKEHVSQAAPIRLNVVKAPVKKKTHTYYGGGWNMGGAYSWNSDWEDEKETEKAQPKTSSYDEYNDDKDVPEIKFPEELMMLEELHEELVVTTQEAMEYYAKWYARETSTEDLEDELQTLFYEKEPSGGQSRKDADEEDEKELEEKILDSYIVHDVNDDVETPKVSAVVGGSE